MGRWRSFGTIVLATVVVLGGQLLGMPLSVSASSGTPQSSVSTVIEVPAGNVLLFERQAAGVQTYECTNGQWTLRAPRALLFTPQSHKLSGIHYGGIDRDMTPGPWWESTRDGSRIRGGNPVSAPSPNANSIPLLRLEVLERQGTGVFSPTTYIQRLNTTGGVGPTGACQAGAQRWIPYTADYAFYGPQ